MSEIVTTLGPLGVFLLMVPESACIPVPSEVTLMSAGFAVRSGWMPFWAAVAAAVAGNLLGSLVAYGVGRLGRGRELGPRATRAVSSCERLFDRHQDRAVFVARLLPLARTFVSLPAGFARVPLGRFVAMTLAGCAIWAAAFVLLGALVGSGWEALAGPLGPVLLGVGVIAIGAWWLIDSRRHPPADI